MYNNLFNFTQDSSAQSTVGSPPHPLNPQIIGAEDDYFDSQQEQVSQEQADFMSHYLHRYDYLSMKIRKK